MDDSLVGTTIDRYKLLECINKTDLIGYFKAYDTKLERNVIMKLVLHSAEYSEDAVQYFLNESRALAKLVHPNIAKVLDFGFQKGNLYLISEYIPGNSLSTLINGAMEWRQVVAILLPLIDALNYAHSKGVIHRDLKPENITIAEDGRLILNDFSLVKIIESEETRDMTGTKVGLGSPAYISPEQGKGLPVDFRSDIYSLGVIFYELITGQKPFSHGNSMEIVIQHVTSEPPRPKSIVLTLPDQVEKIILTALSKDISKRYQSMQEFSDAIQAILQGVSQNKTKQKTRLSGWTNWVVALASFLLIIPIVGFSLWKFSQTTGIDEPSMPTVGGTVITSAPTITMEVGSPTPSQQTMLVAPTAIPEHSDESDDVLRPGVAIDANASTTTRQEDTNINIVEVIDNGSMLMTGTDAGLFFYNSSDLTLKYFLDTKGPVSAAVASKDGDWIATGDKNGNVAVWNLVDGTEIARFEGHVGELVSLDISPDKSKLVSAAGNIVYLWDINKKALLFTINKHALSVNKVLFSRDGFYAISGGDDFQVMFWDVNTGEFIKKYEAAQKINDISVSSDSTIMVLALNDAAIEIRDFNNGQIQRTLRDNKIVDPYKFSKLLPNNSLFITGSENGIVRLWNINGNLIWETARIEKKFTSLESIAISDDGVRLVTVSNGNLVSVWDIPQKNVLVSGLPKAVIPQVTSVETSNLVISLPQLPVIAGAEIPKTSADLEKETIKDISELARWGSPKISTISFIDHSNTILAATSAGVYFYSTKDLSLQYFFDTKGWLSTFSVSIDGTWVATGDQNGNVAVWNIVNGEEIARFEGQPGEVISVAISPDKTLLTAVTDNRVISLWDLEKKELRYLFKKQDSRVNKVLFTHDGQYVVSGGDDFQVKFWDVNTGNFVKKYPSTQKINDISISPDSTIIALALNDAAIELMDFNSGEIRKTFKNIKIVDSFEIIKFLPSNSLLVTGSENGIVRIWNINGTSIWETPRQDKNGKAVEPSPIKSITISDDGTKLATLSEDNSLYVWDIGLKSLLVSKKISYGAVQRMSVSLDNKMLAYQAGDADVELWSIENHEQIAHFSGALPRGYPFSPSGEFLVIVENDTLSLYSLKSTPAELLHKLYRFPFNGAVNYLLGDKIVAVAMKGTFKYWSVSSGVELIASSVKYEGDCRILFHENGQFLAAGSSNGIINLDQNLKYFCNVPRGPRTISEDFLEDGSIIALSMENQTFEVWNMRVGEQKKTIKANGKGDLYDIAISNDGKLLAIASADGIIEIYDLVAYELLNSFLAHTADVGQISFTNDLKYLISASADGTVRFWGISQ